MCSSFSPLRERRKRMSSSFFSSQSKKEKNVLLLFSHLNKKEKNVLLLFSHLNKKEKNVPLLSSVHSASERCEKNGKPEIALTYKKTTLGVDAVDQMVHAFAVKRKKKEMATCGLFNNINRSK
ncbi:PiggyBac transposable element-derived protein 4 [Plakobranchus ocellatus]|uniref:PiggyBac transposable element-derived protein 4 n=1 Tax=Plakobranchus ocellatus TaxID=259542 RepID=A0AAV4BI17_9GAST|nr:PiggyBac transposable element-derived protein 4 [Plakobranchus ocellatus]